MQLIIAVFLGAFIGIEREMYMSRKNDEIGFLGMRTNIFITVIGVISTFFVSMPYLPVVLF